MLAALLLAAALPVRAHPLCDAPDLRRKVLVLASERRFVTGSTVMAAVYAEEKGKRGTPLADMSPELEAYVEAAYTEPAVYGQSVQSLAGGDARPLVEALRRYERLGRVPRGEVLGIPDAQLLRELPDPVRVLNRRFVVDLAGKDLRKALDALYAGLGYQEKTKFLPAIRDHVERLGCERLLTGD